MKGDIESDWKIIAGVEGMGGWEHLVKKPFLTH